MVSPDLSPFLRQLGPHQGRPFMPTPAVAVGPFGGGAPGLPFLRAWRRTPGRRMGCRPFPRWHWLHFSCDPGSCKTTLFQGCCGASPGCGQRDIFMLQTRPATRHMAPPWQREALWGGAGGTTASVLVLCFRPSQLRVLRCQNLVSVGSQMLKKAFQKLGGPNRVESRTGLLELSPSRRSGKHRGRP